MIGKLLCRIGFHTWACKDAGIYLHCSHCKRCGIRFSEWANKEYGAH